MLSSRKHAPRDWREAMRPVGAAAAILCGLIVITDLGSAIAVGLAAAAVLIASGAAAGRARAPRCRGRQRSAACMIAAEPYRMQRLTAFLHPGDKIGAAGYQLYEAKLALGTGGLFGVGLGQSVTKLSYLPEAHTDMIVPIVGEELGLIGVFGLLVAFGLFAWCGYSVALRAKDPFGKLLAAGLTTLIVGQAVLNIGGTLGVLPFTGVPVPLISYGGTSLIATLAAIGLVLSVGTLRRQALRVADARAHAGPQARARAALPHDPRRQRARRPPPLRARGAAGRCDDAARARRGRRHRRPRDARAGGGRGARPRRRRGDVRGHAGARRGAARRRRPAIRSMPSASRASRAGRRSRLARALALDVAAPVACVRILRRRRPHAVLGGGGYVAGPMLLAARALGIPRVLTEADAHLGLANRLAAPLADRVFLAYPLPGRRAAALRGRRAAGPARLLRDDARRGARRARPARRTPSCWPSSARSPAPAASTTPAWPPTGPTGSRTASSCTSPGRATTTHVTRGRDGAAGALPHARGDRPLLDGAGGGGPRREPRRRHGLGARGGRSARAARTLSPCHGRPSARERDATSPPPAVR